MPSIGHDPAVLWNCLEYMDAPLIYTFTISHTDRREIRISESVYNFSFFVV
jgi:hypothetical protein